MNDTITITRLLTDKLALNHSRIDTPAMPLPLAQGEALLKISRVAMTTGPALQADFDLRGSSIRDPALAQARLKAQVAPCRLRPSRRRRGSY